MLPYLLYVVQLTISDHFEVAECLKYHLNKEELIQLGGALGLHYSNLEKMKCSDRSLCDELVFAWLNEEDDVMLRSGKPSWESLMTALRTMGFAQWIQRQRGTK